MSKDQNERNIMKKTSVSTDRVLKLSALIACLVALAMAGCATNRNAGAPAAHSSFDSGTQASPTAPMSSPNGSLNF
jgi:hypothetical protein